MHIYPEPFLSRLAWVILTAYFPFFLGLLEIDTVQVGKPQTAKTKVVTCVVYCVWVFFITLLICKILICKKMFEQIFDD